MERQISCLVVSWIHISLSSINQRFTIQIKCHCFHTQLVPFCCCIIKPEWIYFPALVSSDDNKEMMHNPPPPPPPPAPPVTPSFETLRWSIRERICIICIRIRNLQSNQEEFHYCRKPDTSNEPGLPPPPAASSSRRTEGQNQTCW